MLDHTGNLGQAEADTCSPEIMENLNVKMWLWYYNYGLEICSWGSYSPTLNYGLVSLEVWCCICYRVILDNFSLMIKFLEKEILKFVLNWESIWIPSAYTYFNNH